MRVRLAGGGEVDNDIAVTVESAGVAHVGIVVRRDVDVVVFGPADALQVDRDRRPRGSRSRRNVDDAGLDDEVRPCDEVVASANGQSVQTAEVVRNRQRPIDSAVDVGCDFANLVFLRREAAVRHPAPDRGLPDQPHRLTGREPFALQNGEGFAPGKSMRLVWETSVGSRVTDGGFTPQENEIGEITTDVHGRIDRTLTIPDDLGGLHGLALRRGDDLVARTHFVIETSIIDVSPRSGPAGTPVTIHLKGVGWTEYDNIYVATYDNAYMGYACGFNSHGDVVINFTATGEPDAHLIDLYPGIYQGPPTEPQQLYRLPQLTYADDHPGNKIPAIRVTFDITP